MLHDDAFTFYCILLMIQLVYMITPVSIAITLIYFVAEERFRAPHLAEHIALAETAFYLAFFLPRRYILDSTLPTCTRRTRLERRELFYRCISTISDLKQWLSIWFKEASPAQIYSGDVQLFLAWGFLNKTTIEDEDLEELEEYMSCIEGRIGARSTAGCSRLQPCRVSTDGMHMQHKSLLFYLLAVSVMDTACYATLKWTSLVHYRVPAAASLSIYPLRPLTIFSRDLSPTTRLSYWYRPHMTKTCMPILFLHGIGIGLPLYTAFLHRLAKTTEEVNNDGQTGILAIELMPISFRVTESMPSQHETVKHIQQILDHHGWSDFVIVAHSFGSIIATHLLRDLSVVRPVDTHPLVLIDPVTLSIHFAEIPYNFIYRKPRTASELLCSFAATDIGVCPAIMRLFDWTQNVLWLDEIGDRPLSVFLAGKDCIVDTHKLRQYLLKNGFTDFRTTSVGDDSGVDICEKGSTERIPAREIVLHEMYNHGEIFMRSRGRKNLVDCISRSCARSYPTVDSGPSMEYSTP